jgi:hypothetical protein
MCSRWICISCKERCVADPVAIKLLVLLGTLAVTTVSVSSAHVSAKVIPATMALKGLVRVLAEPVDYPYVHYFTHALLPRTNIMAVHRWPMEACPRFLKA